METPVQVKRYGKIVWETPAMDGLRGNYCMCYHCESFGICPISDKYLKLCKEFGNAFIMTRCSEFK